MFWCTETLFSLQQTYYYSVEQLKAWLIAFFVGNYANLQFIIWQPVETPAPSAPKEVGFFSGCMWGLCIVFAGTDSRLVYSRTVPTVDDALRHSSRAISVRVTMSQSIHHCQKVITFAAGTGRLVPRLCELSHDLGKLCIGLLVLKDNVIHQSQCKSGHYSVLYLITVNSIRPAKPYIS